jgi:hypothetical protein
MTNFLLGLIVGWGTSAIALFALAIVINRLNRAAQRDAALMRAAATRPPGGSSS